MFNKQHSMLLDASTSRPPNSIKDSPLANRSGENRLSAGYIYRFR